MVKLPLAYLVIGMRDAKNAMKFEASTYDNHSPTYSPTIYTYYQLIEKLFIHVSIHCMWSTWMVTSYHLVIHSRVSTSTMKFKPNYVGHVFDSCLSTCFGFPLGKETPRGRWFSFFTLLQPSGGYLNLPPQMLVTYYVGLTIVMNHQV